MLAQSMVTSRPEAFAHEDELSKLVIVETTHVLGDRRAVAGEILARGARDKEVDVCRRYAPTRQFPIKRDDHGFGILASDRQVPFDEIAMNKRPGQVAADRLDIAPAGLDQLASRDQRSQHVPVVRAEHRVIEVVEDRKVADAEVLQIVTWAALRQG